MRGGGGRRGDLAFHGWKTAGDPGGWLFATVPNGIISFAARVLDSDLRGLPSDRTFQLILYTLHLSSILNRAYSRGIEYLLR